MSASHRVKQAFERHLNLMKWSLNEIDGLFTLSEMSLIADGLNGIMFQSFEVELAPQLQDELTDLEASYYGKWEIAIVPFAQKLIRLTNSEAAALIEAI